MTVARDSGSCALILFEAEVCYATLWILLVCPCRKWSFSGSNNFTHKCDGVDVICGRNRLKDSSQNTILPGTNLAHVIHAVKIIHTPLSNLVNYRLILQLHFCVIIYKDKNKSKKTVSCPWQKLNRSKTNLKIANRERLVKVYGTLTEQKTYLIQLNMVCWTSDSLNNLVVKYLLYDKQIGEFCLQTPGWSKMFFFFIN